jgi:ribonuclease T2
MPNDFDSYVLAVTWPPVYCEHANYKGRNPECNAINIGKTGVFKAIVGI